MKLIKLDSLNLTQTNKVNASLLYENWEIDEIIDNLSEDEEEVLIERISALAETWELTLDAELELSLQTKYKESKTNLSYTDWLYDLAQEKVYCTYAIEKLSEQKKKANLSLTSNKEAGLDDIKEDAKNDAILIGKTNNLANYVNQDNVVTQDNDSLENHLQETNSSQGHQNEINKPLIVSNYDYHITKGFPNYFRKIPINYFYQQNSSFSRANYSWKNSLLLTKAKIALPIPSYLGKHTSIYHPPSLPP